MGGESGPHNGKSPPEDEHRWTNFADSFWYLDAMASKAAAGYAVFCRQDFVGIDYGLVDQLSYTPLPDYFAGLLWSDLMGTGVVKVFTEAEDTVRAWAHCSPASSGGGVTVLLMNLMPPTTPYNINTTISGYAECNNSNC